MRLFSLCFVLAGLVGFVACGPSGKLSSKQEERVKALGNKPTKDLSDAEKDEIAEILLNTMDFKPADAFFAGCKVEAIESGDKCSEALKKCEEQKKEFEGKEENKVDKKSIRENLDKNPASAEKLAKGIEAMSAFIKAMAKEKCGQALSEETKKAAKEALAGVTQAAPKAEANEGKPAAAAAGK